MKNYLNRNLHAEHMFIAAKDKLGKYFYCNEKAAEAIGLDSPGQIEGKTDFDLCWCDQAEIYIEGDQEVMKGKPLINGIEPQTHVDGVKKIFISKTSILNQENECVGVVGSYMDISDYFVKEKTFNLKSVNGKRFYLGPTFYNEYLTKKEVMVLKGVLLGMSAKQVAQYLKVGARTVEYHLEQLKLKLQCRTKGDIIMTALKTGLTFAVLDVDSWDKDE